MITHIKVIKTGKAMQRPFLTRAGGSFKKQEYPITCIELEHTTAGKILIDTGYGDQFLSRLKPVPKLIYGQLFIEKEKQKIDQKQHVKSTYDWLILSHFHPDHIGDLSEVTYNQLMLSKALNDLTEQARLLQLRQGFFKELVPKTLGNSSYFEDERTIECPDLKLKGYDLFGDQTILAIPMFGHALGQYIFYLQTIQGPVLLAMDVAWHIESITDGLLPKKVTKLIVHDFKEMQRNIEYLAQLHQRKPELPIFLSHCQNSITQLLEWDHKNGGAVVDYQEN
jgi:glyoxylase-like metal-dependent hydrolase (beta-lactamase superfamily II)